jgi:hypothetical protein
MGAYRIFFLSECGGVVGSHEFEAPSHADATVMAVLLADACADCCFGFELWQSGSRIARQRLLNDLLARKIVARLSDAVREQIVAQSERIRDSRSRIAHSRRLTATINEARTRRGLAPEIRAGAISNTGGQAGK